MEWSHALSTIVCVGGGHNTDTLGSKCLCLPARDTLTHTYDTYKYTYTPLSYRCEVDPHCCCAELGTEGPIRVDFLAAEQVKTLAVAAATDGAGGGGNADAATTNILLGGKEKDYNFFNEGELVKI